MVATTTFSAWMSGPLQRVLGVAIVAAVVLSASLLGILTRPVGFLAAFWPANAILIGVMVRNPRLASPAGWIAAFLAYIAADLMTGGQLGVTLWLTAANMAGAIAGFLMFQLLPEDDRRLRRPLSVLYLFMICAGAALVAALTGGGAAQVLFGRDFLTGLEFWFVTEFVNSLVILPVILTCPSNFGGGLVLKRRSDLSLKWLMDIAPVLALLASIMAGTFVGGPGAIAFPVPALLWCALTYATFTTAVLTMLVCVWLLVAASVGYILLPSLSDVVDSTTSIRLGVALIALGPLTVASINSARNELVARLSHAANHDSLTGALSRSAFLRDGQEVMRDLSGPDRPVTVLMLDIDHFKRVNDRHGHAAGDKVLIEFARMVSDSLRRNDLFGRLGGEEFAIVLPDTALPDAAMVAERIRRAVEEVPMPLQSDETFTVSVSIGVSEAGPAGGYELDQVLARADSALYQAKSDGRNRVVVASGA